MLSSPEFRGKDYIFYLFVILLYLLAIYINCHNFFAVLIFFQLIDITTMKCQIINLNILTRQDLTLYYSRTNTTLNNIGTHQILYQGSFIKVYQCSSS